MSSKQAPSASELTAEAAALPKGWTVQWSKTHERRFYYRAAAGDVPAKTQWVVPTSGAAAGGGQAAKAASASSSSSGHPKHTGAPDAATLKRESEALPAGWTVQWNQKHKRRYYYRAKSKDWAEKTQWMKPGEEKAQNNKRKAGGAVTSNAIHPDRKQARRGGKGGKGGRGRGRGQGKGRGGKGGWGRRGFDPRDGQGVSDAEPTGEPVNIKTGLGAEGLEAMFTGPENNGIPIWDFKAPHAGEHKDTEYSAKGLPRHRPSARLEWERVEEMRKLRLFFQDTCKRVLDVNAPKESLNRWLLEQTCVPSRASDAVPWASPPHAKSSATSLAPADPKGAAAEAAAGGDVGRGRGAEQSLMFVGPIQAVSTEDPILRCPEVAFSGAVLRRELMAEIPARVRHKFYKRGTAVHALQKYLDGSQAWMQRLRGGSDGGDDDDDDGGASMGESLLPEDLKEEADRIADILAKLKAWMNDQGKACDTDELAAKLADVKASTQPFFAKACTPFVDEICRDLVSESRATADRLAQLTAKHRGEERGLHDDGDKVRLYYNKAKQTVEVCYKKDTFGITDYHFRKLRALYILASSNEDPDCLHLEESVYALLRRYQTFSGISNFEGSGFHASAPEEVFHCLSREFGASYEAFASPLNCYFFNYCSAFPDIDVWFGSLGSFFDLEPSAGSFQIGPPFTQEVLDQMAYRIDHLLASSEKELSFVVCVPDWTEPPLEAALCLARSPYKRREFTAGGHGYVYITGLQHNAQDVTKTRYYKVPHGTRVFILQNSAGFDEWTPTEDKVKRLQKLMSSDD